MNEALNPMNWLRKASTYYSSAPAKAARATASRIARGAGTVSWDALKAGSAGLKHRAIAGAAVGVGVNALRDMYYDRKPLDGSVRAALIGAAIGGVGGGIRKGYMAQKAAMAGVGRDAYGAARGMASSAMYHGAIGMRAAGRGSMAGGRYMGKTGNFMKGFGFGGSNMAGL